MKNLLQTLLVFTMLFSGFSYSVEIDKKVNECHISDTYNLDKTLKETKECVLEELDKDTKAGNLIRKSFTPESSEDTSQKLINIFSAMSFFVMIGTGIVLFKMLTPANQEELGKQKSDVSFKAIVVFFIMSTITTPPLLALTIKDTLNTYFEKPLTFWNSLNYITANSDTVKKHAIAASKSEISEKSLFLSKRIVDSHICATGYFQERVSAYTKEEYLVMKSDEEIKCINDYMQDNSDKTLKELGNRILSSSAIYECSSKFSSFETDCGNVIAESSIPDLNLVVDKFAKEIVEFVDDYNGYKCDQTKLEDKEEHIEFCTTVKNGFKTFLSTDKSIIDIEDSFFNINKEFTTELSLALIKGINDHNDTDENFKKEEEVDLLDLFNVIKKYLSIDSYDQHYQIQISKELKTLNGTKNAGRNRYDGSNISETDNVAIIVEDAVSYFQYVKMNISSLYEHPRVLKDALKDDFAFLTDVKLMFGTYTSGDGKSQFKVDFLVLNYVQDHYLKLVGIGSALKLFSQYQINNGNDSFKWQALSMFSFAILVVAHLPLLLSAFLLIFTIGGITISFLTFVYMAIINISSILFLKKDVIILFNQAIQLYLAFVIKPVSAIFGLAAAVVYVVIGLEVMNYIPLVSENPLITFPVSIVLMITSVIYMFKKIIWANKYLHKEFNTEIESYSGTGKAPLKTAQKML